MDWKKWILATGIGIGVGVVGLKLAQGPTPKPATPSVIDVSQPANAGETNASIAPRPGLTSAKPAPAGTVWGSNPGTHCTTAEIFLVGVKADGTPQCRCSVSGVYLPCPPPATGKPTK